MQKTANQTDIGPYQQLVWTSSGKLQLPRREHGLFRQQQDWSEHSKKHGPAAKGEANVEGVQVGDVFVRLWGEKEKEVVIGVSEKGVTSNNVDMFVDKITDELGVGKEKGDCEALRDKTSSQIDLRQAEFLSRAEGQVSVANQVVTQCEESTGERVNQASERGEQPYPLGNLNIVNPEKTSNPRHKSREGHGFKMQETQRRRYVSPLKP
ncbi:hypothetical protein TSUD_284470 [Trifolium subterraneum]|uniref:Uncharacterized protein n=1 Tax=Trifolium subterraneum TaxID=3900 RepID=A0A2Z6P482_TRISU|nr:hypothetical protein TSUD_284470 [Trifolium subterraneum]